MSSAMPGKDAAALADVTQSVTLVETAGHLETELAGTLRAMATRSESEAAERQLRLAEEAARGAQAAVQRSARLQQLARLRAEHADVIALRRELIRAIQMLADLARTEDAVAGILTRLASRDGSDVAARRRQQAAEASAAARHARDRAQDLRQLAETYAATSTAPSHHPVPQLPGRETAARLTRAREHTADALGDAARAHDRTAQAHERSAGAGIGDVAEHERRAAFHRAAARADRQRAQETHEQAPV